MLSQTIGKKVRMYRLLRQWSQEKLARRADISVETIRRIERGKGNPTADVVESLAVALHVNVTLLVA